MDEFLYSLQSGWEIPPGFPRDRFVPTVYGKSDLVAPIVQYLDDFGFTGDARRLHEAARRFYAYRDWKLMTPSPGDDKRWKEFQERYVNPLVHLAGCLQGRIRDVRQLIIDAAGREATTQTRGKGGRKKGSGVKLSKHVTNVSRDTPPKVTKTNDILQQLKHIEAAVATITNVGGTSKRSPNQNCPEKRKQKIRTAIKQKATCRGRQKNALSKKLSRWEKEWSEEYSEVMREIQG